MPEEKNPLYYADYLQLDSLLHLQERESEKAGNPAHDEMLFIVIHQVYELWFRQVLFEIDSIRNLFSQEYIEEKELGVVEARLERILEIFQLLIDQIRVLETMTPLDFLEFRDVLFPASGFQSFQFRLLENKLGLRRKDRLKYEKNAYSTRLSPHHQKMVSQAEEETSLLELLDQWLGRTPFLQFEGFDFWDEYRKSVEKILAQDRKMIADNPTLSEEKKEEELKAFARTEENYAALFDSDKHEEMCNRGLRKLSYHATQAALLIHLYRDEPIFHLPFRILTRLVDLDEFLTTWRYRHALMAQRMIGTRIGTGGSSGYGYLRAAVEKHRLFTDLATLATYFVPRSARPELPEKLKRQLGFFYSGGDEGLY